jgi:hypothetical protein
MVPGFVFTLFAFWYPTWVDRSIPEEYDSRIWMLVAFTMRYTWWASLSVVVAYAFLAVTVFKLRNVRALVPFVLGLFMFAPSAWLVWSIGVAWLRN